MKTPFHPNPNSFKNTFCVFNQVLLTEIENQTIQYKSKSGSCYYFTNLGMYRLSNHWGRLANSKWRLEPVDAIDNQSKYKLGFALWTAFYPDNKHENLYYIEVDFEKNTANYQHKNNPKHDKKAVLRTSFETTKRIKQIRNLVNLTSWAKHFEYKDIDELRKKIINELIFTNKTLDEIKREL